MTDIFMPCSGTEAEFNSLYAYFNSCHPPIKLTLEAENESFTIFGPWISGREGTTHSSNIYRKQSATVVYIPNDSHHLPQYNVSSIIYMTD